MKLLKVTVVTVNNDSLSKVDVGTQLCLHHEQNDHDEYAIEVSLPPGVVLEGEDVDKLGRIGFVSASEHTTLDGCVTSKELYPYLQLANHPQFGEKKIAFGKVESHKKVSFRNGAIRTALILDVFVADSE